MTKTANQEKLEAIVNKFEEELKKVDEYVDICEVNVRPAYGLISWSIEWGDWKHQHLCSEWTMEEVLKSMGFKNNQFVFKTNVTEEDGSDCYSAIHSVLILGLGGLI